MLIPVICLVDSPKCSTKVTQLSSLWRHRVLYQLEIKKIINVQVVQTQYLGKEGIDNGEDVDLEVATRRSVLETDELA